MKLLAAADFHEDEELMDAVIEEANSGEYNLVLLPGDFVVPKHYERMRDEIEPPVFGCTGNWDFDFTPPENDAYEHLFNYMKIDWEAYKIGTIGAVFPDDFQDDLREWTEDHDDRRTIVMSHYPPERLGDATVSGNRAGMEGFRQLIMTMKPAVWFCGHIHEAFGHYSLMETDVFNCAVIESGKCFAVEMDDDGVEDFEEVELR